MTLPRFTSGRVGRLDFSHINEAFGAIDDLRNEAGVGGMPTRTRGRLITARVSSQTGSLSSWVEVERVGTAFVVKENGLSSAYDGNPLAHPIVGQVPDDQGRTITIAPQYDADGKLFYMWTGYKPEEDEVPKPWIIIGHASWVSGRSWIYQIRRAQFGLVGNIPQWTIDTAMDPVLAVNTCEYKIDPVGSEASGLYGVGWGKPQKAYPPSRNPITNDTIVMATAESIAGYYLFTVGNGYSTSCLPSS